MRLARVLPCVASLVLLAGPAGAAGEGTARVPATLQAADPCAFFRGHAFGKARGHYTTEMLWACEAIAARRAADLPHGDRLAAVDAALQGFHGPVVAAGRASSALVGAGRRIWG